MSTGSASARLSSDCPAPAEAVYDLLADVRSHLDWGGRKQSWDFRLRTLEAPLGRAAAGTEFSSTGSIPMSTKRWQDRSTVTVAEPGSVFEFVTEARAGATAARYRHRYEMAPAGAGCRVTYTLTQESIANPMLRLALPGIRTMMWRVGIPMYAGRGFRNLLRAAAERAGRPQPAGDLA